MLDLPVGLARGQRLAEALLRQVEVEQHRKHLRLPRIAGQCASLAAEAERERQGYLGYLDALLQAEWGEREEKAITRRGKEAHLPRAKTLAEFDFSQTPRVSAAKIEELAEGGYDGPGGPKVGHSRSSK